MISKARPKRTKGSRDTDKLEPEEFIASMERRKDWATVLALFLGVVFAAVVILQALGYSKLEAKPFVAIVLSLLGVMTFVIKAAFKRR
jgi:nicotinamide riboside transporter PnuC